MEFKLPDVGEGMHEGTITKWLIKEGDFVHQDQPVVEVQTDKVNAELTAPVTGVVNKIFFFDGDTIDVGSTLFTIQEELEVSSTQGKVLEQEKSVLPEIREREGDGKPITHSGLSRVLATPFVRQMAREMKIDIHQVRGTGPAGRVTENDLQQFAEGKQVELVKTTEVHDAADQVKRDVGTNKVITIQPEKQSEERIPLKGIRKKIAEQMIKSFSLIPHVTHVDELEIDALKALRDQLKVYSEEKNMKLTFLPFFIKAIVIALKEFPTLNASIDEKMNEIVLKNYYNIGIATDTKDGLIVPVIKNADQKTIFQLADEISQLAALAREGKLTLDQITGSTFTISNVGPIGGLHATPIINHPEVAILALHKMEPRMVVRDWEGVIRLMMNMSLSFDHRLIDGVTAVRFTNRIKELLENPNLLLVEMK